MIAEFAHLPPAERRLAEGLLDVITAAEEDGLDPGAIAAVVAGLYLHERCPLPRLRAVPAQGSVSGPPSRRSTGATGA
jgi:hypothetical protein